MTQPPCETCQFYGYTENFKGYPAFLCKNTNLADFYYNINNTPDWQRAYPILIGKVVWICRGQYSDGSAPTITRTKNSAIAAYRQALFWSEE